MKLSYKLGLIATASLLSISSFALDLADVEGSAGAGYDLSAFDPLAETVGESAVAVILQAGTNSTAKIEQTGANFAMIGQNADGAYASITQTSVGNIAFVYQTAASSAVINQNTGDGVNKASIRQSAGE